MHPFRCGPRNYQCMAIFDQPLTHGRKPGKGFWVFLVLVAIVIFVLVPSVGPYTEYLWYSEDARHPQVFWLLYRTKSMLFAISFVISLAMIYLNVARALKISTVYSETPSSVGEVLVSKFLTVLQNHGPLVGKLASLVLAIMLSLGFSDEWMA